MKYNINIYYMLLNHLKLNTIIYYMLVNSS